jgi:hypothetical protein
MVYSAECEAGEGEGLRTSFLKKRSKKLLLIAHSAGATRVAPALPETDKSFLVLFFKKEQLPWAVPRGTTR